MPSADLDHLREYLEPIPLILSKTLHRSGAPIEHVHFIEHGFGSAVADADGNGNGSIEVGLIGNEGMTGIAVVLGTDRSPTKNGPGPRGRAATGCGSPAHRPGRTAGDPGRAAALRAGISRPGHATAVCNRLHSLDGRLARWLLMAHDRSGGDEPPLTQEFLSLMLGVRRAGVTVSVGSLAEAGLIGHSRGRITVVDRAGLEAASCTCYGIVQSEYRRLLG